MSSAWDLDSSLREAVAALTPDTDTADAQADEPADERADEQADEQNGELSGDQLREWYDAMLTSRQLDLAGHWLRSWNEGYHSVSSAGHEATAAVAAALRPTDPVLLYPRSGGFYCARAAQVPASDPVLDVLGAVVGAATEPMAGGRHTPYGSRALAVVPASGNGAAHLPRAMGLAFAIDRGRRLGVAGALDLPED
ncbi:MAG: transketolase, partial [Micromonosporaceae bacterium]